MITFGDSIHGGTSLDDDCKNLLNMNDFGVSLLRTSPGDFYVTNIYSFN